MDSQALNMHQPLIQHYPFVSKCIIPKITSQYSPTLLQPHHIVNHIAIQLWKHALQRFNYDFVFLHLYPSRLFSLRRSLSRGRVFCRHALPLLLFLWRPWLFAVLCLRGCAGELG
jgi:hypothetical protein